MNKCRQAIVRSVTSCQAFCITGSVSSSTRARTVTWFKNVDTIVVQCPAELWGHMCFRSLLVFSARDKNVSANHLMTTLKLSYLGVAL